VKNGEFYSKSSILALLAILLSVMPVSYFVYCMLCLPSHLAIVRIFPLPNYWLVGPLLPIFGAVTLPFIGALVRKVRCYFDCKVWWGVT